MLEYFVYGIGFFLATLLIQFLLSKRKNKNSKFTIWTGSSVVIIIAFMGIFLHKPQYLSAIIGYTAADMIGHELGWH